MSRERSPLTTGTRLFNLIRWPDADGHWWLVSETVNGYSPLMELHPICGLEPTWNNQLWSAAELLVTRGLDALRNPHAATGKECGCMECFCCAAWEVLKTVGGAACL